jgi:hypothetical protein
MLRRAWGRSVALLMRHSGALILPNLQASLGMGFSVAAFLAAVALKAPMWVFVALKGFAACSAWMSCSWLSYNARMAFEDPHHHAGLAQMGTWFAARGKERLLSFLGLVLGAFWIGLALGFYGAASASWWVATLGLVIVALAAYVLASTVMMNLALASRGEAHPLAEWKGALLMALAFAPQCLGAMLVLLLLSGAGAFLAGPAHWWGRLMWVPALALPVFGAGLAAAFWVSLSDEFLARSHGVDPPAYEPFKFRELMRPWK